MKRKTFGVWCPLITLFLGLAACTPKAEEIEPATLTVAPGELKFNNGEGSEVLKVETNQASWAALSPQEGSWIELSQAGNSLTVKAQRNNTSEPRTGYIFVNAGGATPQKVKVTQEPANITLSLFPEEINVPILGGTYPIDISSNSDAWTLDVEPAVEWITLTVYKGAKIAYLTVKENDTEEDRTAVIRAKNKTKTVDLVITQASLSSLKYVMPILARKPVGHDLITEELNRGAYLKDFQAAIPDWKVYKEDYHFANKSKVFQETKYTINIRNHSLITAVTFSSDFRKLSQEKRELVDFYKKNDFDIPGSADGDIIKGRHKTLPFDITIKFDQKKNMVSVEFAQFAIQTESFPTLDKMPKVNEEYFFNPKWKYDEIKAAENAKGNQVIYEEKEKQGTHVGKIKFVTFGLPENEVPLIARGYFFDWKKDTPAEKLGLNDEIVLFYDKPTLAFWLDEDVSESYILTNEIKELLNKEGWVFYRDVSGYIFYYHPGKKMMVSLLRASYGHVNSGAPVFQLSYFPRDLGGSSVSNAQIDAELNARIERWSKMK